MALSDHKDQRVHHTDITHRIQQNHIKTLKLENPSRAEGEKQKQNSLSKTADRRKIRLYR